MNIFKIRVGVRHKSQIYCCDIEEIELGVRVYGLKKVIEVGSHRMESEVLKQLTLIIFACSGPLLFSCFYFWACSSLSLSIFTASNHVIGFQSLNFSLPPSSGVLKELRLFIFWLLFLPYYMCLCPFCFFYVFLVFKVLINLHISVFLFL